jgi:hypothetical protein
MERIIYNLNFGFERFLEWKDVFFAAFPYFLGKESDCYSTEEILPQTPNFMAIA